MCCNWFHKMFGGKKNCCQHQEENASVNSTVNPASGQEKKPENNQPENSQKVQ